MNHRYSNGRVALSLIDSEGPVATATINLPDVPLGRNEVCIKDYAENTTVLAVLTEAGIVKPTGQTVRFGFVEIPVCELLGPFREPTLAEGVGRGNGRGR